MYFSLKYTLSCNINSFLDILNLLLFSISSFRISIYIPVSVPQINHIQNNVIMKKNQFIYGKIRAIYDECKRKGGIAKFSYKQLARQITQRLQVNGLAEEVSEQQVNYLINEDVELDIPKALALAHVLGAFVVDFLPKKFSEIGDFDMKLRSFESPSAADEYLLQLETNGRLFITSHFPSYLYIPTEYFRDQNLLEQRNHEKRLAQLKEDTSFTTEYYDIFSVLEFVFGTFSYAYSQDEKKRVLNTYLELFSDSRKNRLYFFSTQLHNKKFSTYQLDRKNNAIVMNTPLHESCFLEIRHPAIYRVVSNFFEHPNTTIQLLDAEESIELVTRLLEMLKQYPMLGTTEVAQFYRTSEDKLKNMINNRLIHLHLDTRV